MEFSLEHQSNLQLANMTNKAVEEVLRLTALNVWGEAKREAPVDYGRLRGSIELEKLDELSYRMYSGVRYVLAVHEGSDPHEIVPAVKQALYWPGANHPVKRVMHPGTDPNPFFLRAKETTKARLDEFVRRALEHATAS